MLPWPEQGCVRDDVNQLDSGRYAGTGLIRPKEGLSRAGAGLRLIDLRRVLRRIPVSSVETLGQTARVRAVLRARAADLKPARDVRRAFVVGRLCQPEMLAAPVSMWPRKRCDQPTSLLTVMVKSYQPPA